MVRVVSIGTAFLLFAGCNHNTLLPDGGSAAFQAEPQALEFGRVLLGDQLSLEILLRNIATDGAESLQVTAVEPQGSATFSVLAPSGSTKIDPGETLSVWITFRPGEHWSEELGALRIHTDVAEQAFVVPLQGRGIACEPLASTHIWAEVPPIPRQDLLIQHGLDPATQLEFKDTGVWSETIRFASTTLPCVWVEPEVTLIGLSSTPDGSGDWAIDDTLVVEAHRQDGTVATGFAGNYAVTRVDHQQWDAIPKLADPTLFSGGPESGPYGYPATGKDAVNLRGLILGTEPVRLDVYALDGVYAGRVSELHLFVR